MTTEDDFHRALDANPEDWHTRLVFADWLDDRGDPRAAGYRAIAAQQRRPLQGQNAGNAAWWWYCNPQDTHHNVIPRDWFDLLPAGEGSAAFWPVLRENGGVRSRRECEDALALTFAKLPAKRQAELLVACVPKETE